VFAKRQDTYRAPTWSWASLDFISNGYLYLDMPQPLFTTPLVRVLDYQISSPNDNIYTDITSAALMMEGRVELVQLSHFGGPFVSPNRRDNSHGGYTLDTESEFVGGAGVFCLPILLIREGVKLGSIMRIYALLLKPVAIEEPTFERIGVAAITNKNYTRELRWLFGLAFAEDPLDNLPHRIRLV
jgi:hypothetical protein